MIDVQQDFSQNEIISGQFFSFNTFKANRKLPIESFAETQTGLKMTRIALQAQRLAKHAIIHFLILLFFKKELSLLFYL